MNISFDPDLRLWLFEVVNRKANVLPYEHEQALEKRMRVVLSIRDGGVLVLHNESVRRAADEHACHDVIQE
jgi:hypothetical protein